MKAALLVLAVLQVISGAITAIATFTQSFILGILAIALIVLGVVPIFALIRCMDDIDELRPKLQWLTERVYKLENQLSLYENPVMIDVEQNSSSPGAYERHTGRQPQGPGQTAKHRWICPKCQSVNAEGTSSCQECGARYTSEIGSVEERPLTKWKLKDYKKKEQ